MDNDLLRNGSGIVDYTAYRAITNISKGEQTMKAGDIWEVEMNNGTSKEVVILAARNGYCTVLVLGDYNDGYPVISREQKYTDVGRVQYIFNDSFTNFVKQLSDVVFADLKAAVAEALGIEQKTVEVPVETVIEKVVEVPVPMRCSDSTAELVAAKAEANVYKNLYEQLLGKLLQGDKA